MPIFIKYISFSKFEFQIIDQAQQLQIISNQLFLLMKIQTQLPDQLSRLNGYTIKVLTNQHKQAAIQLVAQEFSKKEPLSSAYYKELGGSSLEGWRRYWQGLSQDLLDSGLSVGCFDQKTNELVGTIFCKDMSPIPISKTSTFGKPNFWIAFSEFGRLLLNNIPQFYKDILSGNDGKVFLLRGGAMKNQHMGKKLIPKLATCIEYLAYKKGYNYSFALASNVKSADGFIKLKYNKIFEFDARLFEYHGKRIFLRITDDNKNQTLWLKRIRQTQPVLPKL